MCVCVCVCVRERERKREREVLHEFLVTSWGADTDLEWWEISQPQTGQFTSNSLLTSWFAVGSVGWGKWEAWFLSLGSLYSTQEHQAAMLFL